MAIVSPRRVRVASLRSVCGHWPVVPLQPGFLAAVGVPDARPPWMAGAQGPPKLCFGAAAQRGGTGGPEPAGKSCPRARWMISPPRLGFPHARSPDVPRRASCSPLTACPLRFRPPGFACSHSPSPWAMGNPSQSNGWVSRSAPRVGAASVALPPQVDPPSPAMDGGRPRPDEASLRRGRSAGRDRRSRARWKVSVPRRSS